MNYGQDWPVPQVLLYNSSFINGVAENGGAVTSVSETNLEVRSCYFEYNRAYIHGGAIYIAREVSIQEGR